MVGNLFRSAGLAAILCLAAAASAQAQTTVWNGTNDNLWGTAADWSAGLPVATGTASFSTAGNGNTSISLGGSTYSVGTILFDTASAAAYNIGGSGTLGTLQFQDGTTNIVTMNSTVANNEIISANILLGSLAAGTSTITNNSTSTLTLSGSITAGTGGTAGAKVLTIAGSGQTILSGNITRGTATSLAINDTATGQLTLSGTSTILTLTITQTNAVVNLTGGNLSLANAGGSSLLSSNNATINGGTITLTAGTAGTATTSGNYADFGATAGTLTVNSVIASGSGIGVDFYPVGGTVVLTGLNTFSGPADVYSTVSVSRIGNIGMAGGLGLGTVLGTNAGGIAIGNGTTTNRLIYTGSGEQTNRTIDLAGSTGGATLDQSGSGLLEFTSTASIVSPTAGAKTITLQGSTTGVGRLDAAISTASNGGAALALTKAGTGTWIVAGTNSYTGATTISAGTLVAMNHTALGSTSAVTVAANAGLSYVAPTDTTLALGSTLAFSGAATLGGTIGSTTTSAEIITAGNATSTAAALTVNVYGLNSVTPATGTYTLLHGGGTANTLSNFSSIALGKVLNNTNWTVGPLAKTATDITVGITAATPITAAFWTGGLTGATNIWAASNGTSASNWLTAGGGATAVVPGAGADVTISASTVTTAPTATVLGANMSISTLTIADTVNGLGLLADGYALTIAPASAATGITTNTGVPASTIGSNIVLGGSQTWTINNAGLTVSGGLSGSGALTIAGTGPLTIGSGGSYSGGLTLNGTNTVNLNNTLALGTGTFTINAAATLDNGTGAAYTNPTNNAIAINSSFAFAGGTSTTHDLNFGTGAVTLGVAPTITINNASTVTFGGSVTGSGTTITKAGSGTLTLTGVIGTSTGGLAVTGGTLIVGNAANTFTGAITLDGAATVLQVTSGSNGSATAAPLGIYPGGTNIKQITITNGATFQPNASWNFNVVTAALPGNGYQLVFGTGGGFINTPSGVTLTLDDGTAAGTTASSAEYLATSGTTSITKIGVGQITLAKQNLFTAPFNVNAGTILTSGADTFGVATNAVSVAAGAVINLDGVTFTRAYPLTLAGAGLASAPLGALTNSVTTAAGTWVGPVTIASGGATLGGGAGALTLTAAASINLGSNVLTINDSGGSGRTSTSGVISGTGSIVLNGNGTSDWTPGGASTYSGTTTVNPTGLLALSASSTGPAGAPTSGPVGVGTLILNGGGLRAGTGGPFTLANPIAITANSTFYTNASEKSLILTGPVTLTGSTITLTSTVGVTVPGATVFLNGAIGDGGSNLGLIKAGAGNLSLGGANTYTGGTTVSTGSLFLTGTLPGNTALTIAGGTSFSLQSNAANPLASISTFSLGTAATTTNLAFDLGASTSTSDSLMTPNAATAAGTIAVNINSIAGFGTSSSYTLLSAASGLSGATYTLGSSVAGGYTYTLSASNTAVVLNLTAAPSGNVYWRGAVNSSWAALSAGATNWTTDAAGSINAGFNPGPANTVIFSAAAAAGPTIATTLDGNFTVNAVQFTSAPAGVTAVSIGNGLFNVNTLTIAPSSASVGISVAQGAGAVTISAPLALGAPQTWSVDSSTPASGTASSLTINGPISGTGTNGVTFTTVAGTTPILLASAAGTSIYSGGSTVSPGTIVQGGAANAFSANTAWTVNGTLNTGAFAQLTGSLVGGTGIVANGSTTAAVLTLGNDNLAAATFPGTLQNGSTAALAITKTGSGTQIFSGIYSYSGATTVNAGTLRLAGTSTGTTTVTVNNAGSVLQFGSATALTASNSVSLTAGATLDLFGNSVTIGTLTNVATATITNNGTSTGASTATTAGSPSLTDALTINTAALTSAIPALITDGTTRKTQIVLNDANLGTVFPLTNAGNTFSGGLVLANNVSGTRFEITANLGSGTAANITSGLAGVGPIIVGQSTTDKAGIYIPNANTTVLNPIIMNTALGTDRTGVRVDATGTVLAGTLTANLSNFLLSTNATGAVALTGQITGPSGLTLDGSTYGTLLTVTLNNATANPNNYTGDTTVTTANAARTMALTLGASDQIPNGTGKGNLVLTQAGTGIATFNMAGFNETINGLNGNGIVDGISGTPTFTLGDGNATASFSGVIQNSAGTLSLVKIGTGTQTLSGNSTFSGSVTVNGGTLLLTGNNTFAGPITINATGTVSFASSPASFGPLGNSPVVNLNGGTLSYSASGTNDLGRPVAIGSGSGTINVASSTGTLTIEGVTSSGGNLIKTGPGTAILAGSTTLNGGAAGVTVSGGTLTAGFGTSGIATLTVGTTGNLNMSNSAIEALTLGSTAGALTLSSGAQLGFELNGATNDSIAVPTGGTALASGTVTLNFFNFGSGVQPGTYNLLTAPGGLTSGGTTYALGNAPNGFNYTIIATDTLVKLTTAAYTAIYWTGAQDSSWNTINSGATNWSLTADGFTDPGYVPGPVHTVIFSASNVNTFVPLTTTLDAAFTIDSLQFLPSSGVTILPGNGGSLTLHPASSSGGILVAANAGPVVIWVPLTIAAPQTWNVDGSNGGASLTVMGNTAFNATVTKTNSGSLTLTGNNSGSGAFILSGGTLNINSPTALGAGPFTINAGTTIDNTTFTPITLTSNNAQNWNGDFTFNGSNDLNLGTGAVSLGSSLVITANAGNFTVGGSVTGTNVSIIKAGFGTLLLNGNLSLGSGSLSVTAGALTLAGANSFSGGVSLTGAALNINNAAALGTGLFAINSGTIDNTTAAPIVLSTNNAQSWNGSFTFNGTQSLDLGTGAVTLTATPTLTVSANTLAVGGAINGTFGLTKAGTGTLALYGASGYSGNTTLAAGTLALSGSISSTGGSLIVGSAANTATLTLAGSGSYYALNGNVTVGSAANSTAIVNVVAGTAITARNIGGANGTITLAAGTGSSGVINQTGGSVTSDTFFVGGAPTGPNFAYAFYNQTGGTLLDTNSGTSSRFRIAASNGSNVGLYYLSGGTATLAVAAGTGSATGIDLATAATGSTTGSTPIGVIDITGTGQMINLNTAGTLTIAGTINTTVASVATGQLTIGGSGSTAAVYSGGTITTSSGTAGAGNLGNSVINVLSGGTLNVGAITKQAYGTSYVNFIGGTLKAATAGATFGAQTGVYTYAGGGATFDTNGLATYIIAAPILAPTGSGVSGITLASGGSGYIGAPAVTITGGSGVGATAIAQVSGGQVTGIVITSPGTGYSPGDSLTVNLVGGGTANPASIGTVNFTTNVSGGLTKINSGSLILTGASTYTDATAISGGTLQLGNAGATGAISPTSAISIASGAVLAFNRTAALVQGTDFYSGSIAGNGSVLQAGTGAVTFNVANSWTGGTTNSSTTGAIIVAANGALGSGPLNLNANPGGTNVTFQLNGSGLTFSNAIAINSSMGREAISSINGNNTLSSAITVSAPTANANTIILTNDGAAGTIFTVSGNITAPANFTGTFSLRAANATSGPLGTISGTINAPAAILDNNVGGVWTIASTGNVWAETQFNSTVTGTSIKVGANSALPTAADVLWAATSPSILDLNGFNQTVAGVAATLATASITNTGSANSILTLANLTSASKVFPGVISDGPTNKTNLVLNSPGKTQILSGTNTFTGTTTITAGTLQLGNAGTVGTLAASGSLIDNDTFTINRTNAAVQGTDFPSAGITGSGNFVQAGTGTTTFTATNTYNATTVSAGTLQIGNGAAAGTLGTGPVAVAGTLAFNRPDNYALGSGNLITGAGSVVLLNGTVTATVLNQFAATGALVFNNVIPTTTAATPTAILDLTNGGTLAGTASFSSILVQTNSATANVLTLGAPLTLSGGITVGASVATAVGSIQSKLTITGSGSLAITGGNFQIGVSQATINAANNDIATLDLSGLTGAGGFTATVASFNVGQGNTSQGFVILTNGPNTITTPVINIGNSAGNNGVNTSVLTLGTGTNLLQADAINIGISKIGGTIAFASTAAGPGSVTITNSAGTGGSAITIGSNNGTGTGATFTGLLDLRGHASTVTASTLAIGIGNNASTGSVTGTLNFDTGSFTASAITLGSKAGTAGTGTATGSINLSGGTFTVAAGGSFVMATNTATTGAAVATLAISGGTFTSNADITKGGGTATTATITLSGGLLDLVNHKIGTTAQPITFNAQAGTLQNLNELNGGGVLTKSTGGTLILQGVSSYTGGTAISAGTLVAGSVSALGATSGTVSFTGSGAILDLATDSSINAYSLSIGTGLADTLLADVATPGNAGITHALNALNLGNGTLTLAAGANVSGGSPAVSLASLNLSAGSAGSGTLVPTTATFSIGTASIASSNFAKTLVLDGTNAGNSITGTISNGLNVLSLTKSNTSTWVLTGTNTFTGTITLSGGVLQTDTAGINGADTTSGLTFAGGTLKANTAAGITTAKAITATSNILLDATNGPIALSGNIAPTTSGFSFLGGNDVTLSGTNSYTGPTTVTSGTLHINGDHTNATGTVTVSGGALRGVGIIGGNVQVTSGGTIKAGNTAAGTLTLLAGLSVAPGGTFGLQIVDGSTPSTGTPGSSTDLVNLPNPTRNSFYNFSGGTVTIDPAALINVDATVGTYAPGATYSYQVASGAGNQSALNVPDSQFSFTGIAEQPGSASLTGDASGDIFLNFTTTSSVPEPTALLGLAALGLAVLRRRNR